MAAIEQKEILGADEVMQFKLVEKKTFLEFIHSNGSEEMRRSSSHPVLLGTLSKPRQVETGSTKPVPKLVRVVAPERATSECTEEAASPGAASARSCTETWQLASTHAGSNVSLRTCFAGDLTPALSSMSVEVDEHCPATRPWSNPEKSFKRCGSPHASTPIAEGGASDASSTTTGSVEGLMPAESAGSVLHEAKQCRPCAWYWRPGGCTRGVDCLHCHLCLDGELGKRRFENRKLAKERKKQAKAAAVRPAPNAADKSG